MDNFEDKDKDDGDKLITLDTETKAETETSEISSIRAAAEIDDSQRIPDNESAQFAGRNDGDSFTDSTSSVDSEEKMLRDDPVEVSEAATYTPGIVHSVGHLLRNARQERNMSVDDVARQLRLSVQQVEAIEKENFEKLPGRVFLRGFIRNYANLVKLDAEPIIQLLPDQSPVISPVERTPFKIKEISFSSSQEKNGNRLIFFVIALIFLALLVYLVFPGDGWRNKSEERTNTPVELNTGQTTMQLDLPLPSSNEGLDERDRLVSKDPISALNIFGSLYFKFLEDAQIQVIDGSGDTIFEQYNAAGSVQMVSGKRPLFVVIHNAAGVELTYNDRLIEIQPYTNERDGIARFTLE